MSVFCRRNFVNTGLSRLVINGEVARRKRRVALMVVAGLFDIQVLRKRNVGGARPCGGASSATKANRD